MVSDIDIWRSAKLLIDYYGEGAEMVACQRTDKAIDQGDPEGESLWKRVLRAVQELQRQKPSASELLN